MKLASLIGLPLVLGGFKYRESKREARLVEAREKSIRAIQVAKEVFGYPGIAVGVSVDGKPELLYATGYSDVENLVEMRCDSPFRIASISKLFTALCTAKLVKEKKIDLDASIQNYVPYFTEKTDSEGNPVSITLRKLLNHSSGVRGYNKKTDPKPEKDAIADKEFHSNIHYPTVEDAVRYFMNDELYSKPGEFGYSTHAYTLITAALEKAAGTSFVSQVSNLCRDIGLRKTKPDTPADLVANRCRQYYRDTKKNRLVNCPPVDLSNKWGGGGLLSTIEDLLIFGNGILYSYQNSNGPIDQETLKNFIGSTYEYDSKDNRNKLGLGFFSVEDPPKPWIVPLNPQKQFGHSGGAVGAVSNLIIIPRPPSFEKKKGGALVPEGLVIIIAGNLTNGKITEVSNNIARFYWNAIME